MAIDIRGMAPLLQVFDMPTSVRFYRDVLGFEVVSTSEPDGDHFDWALLRHGGVELMLNTAYERDARPPAPDPARLANRGDVALYFGCPDPDAAYAHLRAHGVDAREPVIPPYGMKQVYLTDPDGYNLCFQWPAEKVSREPPPGVPAPGVRYREAGPSDVAALERVRAEGGWEGGAPDGRMARYLAGEHHPQHALPPRVVYVAVDGDSVVGLIAGHLTRRFGCDGELQWILVRPDHRGRGVAAELLRLLAAWFAGRNARRICVDVDPENAAARRFYRKHGAGDLNRHWLVWDDIGAVLGGR